MDNFEAQGGSLHVSTGHESGEFNIRGIILFIAVLVVSAVLTFIAAAGLMRLFEWAEVKYFDKPQIAAEQQLNEQRGQLAGKQGVRPQPDWYEREIDEKTLEKTFTTPRLQYDDAADMGLFLNSEKGWLDVAGKTPDGTIHIPIDRAITLLAKQGLPAVNGTFTALPSEGPLEQVSDFSKRRVQEAGGQVQQPSNQKKK